LYELPTKNSFSPIENGNPICEGNQGEVRQSNKNEIESFKKGNMSVGKNNKNRSRPNGNSKSLTITTNPISIKKTNQIKEDKLKGMKEPKQISVSIFSDSQGRDLANIIREEEKLDSIGYVFPGARIKEVIKDVSTWNERSEVTVIMGGTNDVAFNESKNIYEQLKNKLSELGNKVIVVDVPFRYDLPHWSCINKEIEHINSKLYDLCSNFQNVSVIKASSFHRNHYTTHGFHLNKTGKRHIAHIISVELRKFQAKFLAPLDVSLADSSLKEIDDSLNFSNASLCTSFRGFSPINQRYKSITDNNPAETPNFELPVNSIDDAILVEQTQHLSSTDAPTGNLIELEDSSEANSTMDSSFGSPFYGFSHVPCEPTKVVDCSIPTTLAPEYNSDDGSAENLDRSDSSIFLEK
jgi:hypothetical protein